MSDRRSKLLEALLVLCEDCLHRKEAHTWVATNTGIRSVNNCGMITNTVVEGGTHKEVSCNCRQFVPISPLDIVEMVESDVVLDTLNNL